MAIEKISLPYKDLDDTHTSWWVAAHNPVPVQLRRVDFLAEKYSASTDRIYVRRHDNSTAIAGEMQYYFPVGSTVYVNVNGEGAVRKVLSYTSTGGQSKQTVRLSESIDVGGSQLQGYVNCISGRAGYYLQLRVVYIDYPFSDIGVTRYHPDPTGLFSIDLSGLLQSHVIFRNDFQYDVVNWRDKNLFRPFKVLIEEFWSGRPPYNEIGIYNGLKGVEDKYWYFINGANQTAYPDGCNMRGYVSWMGKTSRAKFLTKFETPKYWPDWPFDLTFIYGDGSTEMRFSQTKRVVQHLDANMNTSLPTDYFNLDPKQATGTNRLMLSQPGPNDSFLKVHVAFSALYDTRYETSGYLNDGYSKPGGGDPSRPGGAAGPRPGGEGPVPSAAPLDNDDPITETKCVEVGRCPQQPLYLCWLNSLGGWDYWMFEYNQTETVETRDSERFRPHIEDISQADHRDLYYRRRAVNSVKLGAENLTLQQVRGIEDLLTSIKVYDMLPDGSRTNVLLRDNSYSIIETRNNRYSVELEIEYPEKYLQEG